MNELNALYQNYREYFPCLESIISDKNIFKSNNHALLFSFLIGYFSNKKINFSDFFNIINNYQKQNFNLKQIDFPGDFKRIAFIFCDYFEKKEKPQEVLNNINNINVINFNINNSNVNLSDKINNKLPIVNINENSYQNFENFLNKSNNNNNIYNSIKR